MSNKSWTISNKSVFGNEITVYPNEEEYNKDKSFKERVLEKIAIYEHKGITLTQLAEELNINNNKLLPILRDFVFNNKVIYSKLKYFVRNYY